MKVKKIVLLFCTALLMLSFQNCASEGSLDSYVGGSNCLESDPTCITPPEGTNPNSLTIDAQSSSITQPEGEDVEFSITVSGSDNITYQWFKNNVGILGENSRTLSRTGLTADDEANYYVVAQDGNGVLQLAQSENITLTVTVLDDPDPVITEYPSPTIEGPDGLTYDYVKTGSSAADEDIFCKVKTGNDNATAISAIGSAEANVRQVAYVPLSGTECQDLPRHIIIVSRKMCGVLLLENVIWQKYFKITCSAP